MQGRPSYRNRIAVIAITAIAVPAFSLTASAAPADLSIDVATHDMSGMPGGAVTRGAMKLFGGNAPAPTYGMTQYPGMPGQYLDIALVNKARPGADAEQAVPEGLKLGPSLPLRPTPVPPSPETDISGAGIGDGNGDSTSRILLYWGCGTEVRPGQPREIRITTRNGKVTIDGKMMDERYQASSSVSAGPTVATWPNKVHGKQVPDKASLVGGHRVTGAGVPDSLRFELQQVHDFMPTLQVAGKGSLDDGMTWNWQPVDRANGYFLTAVGTRNDATVMWSSADVPDAGMGLIGYVDDARVARWIREKVVLAPQVQSCAMPREAFAGGSGMLSMVAYGPERHLQDAPKNPKWNVRVRTKSTAMVPMGMGGAGVSTPEGRKEALKESAKGLLKGLLGR